MKKKILVLSVSLIALSFSEAQAVSALDGIADAYSILNWAGVSVTGGGAAINPPYTTFDSQSHARTADEWNINNQLTWVDRYILNGHDTSAPSTFPTDLPYDPATSTGQTSAYEVFSESTVQFMTGDGGEYSAEARARKDQSYEVTSIGTVTFSIPYFLDVSFADATGDNSEYGWARAWSRLRVWTWLNDDPANGSGSWSDVITGTYTFAEIFDAGSQDSSLAFNYYVGAINPKGTYLRLEVGADTIVYDVNPVPVPPSVLMLLTGCTSLFFMKRRRS